MAASHELIERVSKNPEEASPMDKLILGLAVIGALQEDATLDQQTKAEPLKDSMSLATVALSELRTNPETTEAQKFFLASKVMSEVHFDEIPFSREKFRLYAEMFFTLGGGLETPIKDRVAELREGINRDFMELAEILLYGEIKDELTPKEKIIYLYESFGNFSAEERRQIAITRASQFARDPNVDDEAFGEMVEYFFDKDDQEAFGVVTLAKLEAVVLKVV